MDGGRRDVDFGGLLASVSIALVLFFLISNTIVSVTELQSYLDSGVIDSEIEGFPLESISNECRR